MKDETHATEQNQLSRKEIFVIRGVFVLLCGYIVWLTMFSPGPKFYSFDEYARANAACKNDASDQCVINALKAWRRANPDAPRGDSSRD